jgi:hypothetical protein
MDRALVLFAFAVALGVTRAREPRSGSPCLAEPIVPLDREAIAIEFEPGCTRRVVQQLGADVDLTDFRSTKTRFQLDVTDTLHFIVKLLLL